MTSEQGQIGDPAQCTAARFALASANAGISLIERLQPHGEEAYFLAMGLITNTRAIFFALVNSDATRTPTHKAVITSWRSSDTPALRRFREVIVVARNQFTKQFSVSPLVVRTTSNYANPTYEMPIYIPHSEKLKSVLTPRERATRRILASQNPNSPMRIELLSERRTAQGAWRQEIDTVETSIRRSMID